MLFGGVDHLLDAADERGESGDDGPPRRIANRPIQGLGHHLLRGGVAGQFGVGRVGKQQQDAGGAPFRQRREVNGLPVHRGMVNLEIAGVNNAAPGRFHADAHSVGDAVADPEPGGAEISAEVNGLLRVNGVDDGVPRAAAFIEFDGNEAVGQAGGVHRHGQIRQDVGQRADVILMPVRNQNGAHPFRIGGQIGHVGDNQVNAGHILSGKLDAAVDDDDVIAAFQGQHIFADFAQPAQRNDAQRGGGGGVSVVSSSQSNLLYSRARTVMPRYEPLCQGTNRHSGASRNLWLLVPLS